MLMAEIRCLLPGKKVFHVNGGKQVFASWQKVIQFIVENQVFAPRPSYSMLEIGCLFPDKRSFYKLGGVLHSDPLVDRDLEL